MSYWWPIIFSVMATFIVTLISGICLHRKAHSAPPEKTVLAASAWTFSGSWVTSISALGAVLGTALAATGVTNDVLPGISISRPLELNLLFGALVLAGPVTYSALSRWKVNGPKDAQDNLTSVTEKDSVGTPSALVVGSAVVLLGVFGQLASLILLTLIANLAEFAKVLIFAFLAFAAVIVGVYAGSMNVGLVGADTITKRAGAAAP